MSVLMEFAIFPTDKGESVSQYLKGVMSYLDKLPFSHQLTSMGSIVETETMEEALEVLEKCNDLLIKDHRRIYLTAKFDIRQGDTGRMEAKVRKINNLMKE